MVSKSATWSPAEKVGSMDDLTTEILVRLPVRSLLRFKSVSKHWYSLISNPSFKLPNPNPPSGLFVSFRANKPYLEYDFIPFDIDNPVKPPFISLHFVPYGLMIEHSCNGLMLCSAYTKEYSQDKDKFDECYKYYIYNPTINRFTALPRPETNDNYYSYQCHMGLAFDPSKSPHYKVIYVDCERIPFTHKSSYKIQVYSSQTRTCGHSFTFTLDEKISMYFGPSVYWNDAFHWIHKKGFILYFNLDQEIVHQIKTPLGVIPFGGRDEENYSNYLFESRDHLLVIEILRPHTSKFKIHELMRDYSGWTLRYNVDLDGICGSFPEIMNPESTVTFEFAILALVLGEKEDDSFLVLEIPGKALRFNLISKTFHKLHDFISSRRKSLSSNCNEVFCQWPDVFQFVESLSSL